MSVPEEEARLLAERTRRGTPRVPALTGIRGYAAVAVLIYHATFFAIAEPGGGGQALARMPIVGAGYLGVDLFFLLSGFVLMRTYGIELARFDRGAIGDFAIGRVFRILPLHWTVLAGFVAAVPLMAGAWRVVEPHTLRDLLLCAALVHVWIRRPLIWNAPSWSLSAEWLAYLGFPLIAAVTGRIARTPRSALALAAGALIVLAAAVVWRGKSMGEEVRAIGMLRCLCEFTAGAALARLCQLARPEARTGDRLFIIGCLMLLPAAWARSWELLALPAFAALVVACATDSRWARAVFANRAALWFGEISFSLYLLHWLLLEVAQRIAALAAATPGATVAIIAGDAALTVPLAWATWRWIEVPGQAVGRAIVRRRRAGRARRDAPAERATA